MAEKAQQILESGGTEVKTAAGGARRYRKPLSSFRWHDLKAIFAESLAGWNEHNAPRLGAALGFYTLLSIAPLLLVLVSVAAMALGRQAAEEGVVRQVSALAGAVGAQAVRALLEGSRSTAHGIIATLFGVFTLMFGA